MKPIHLLLWFCCYFLCTSCQDKTRPNEDKGEETTSEASSSREDGDVSKELIPISSSDSLHINGLINQLTGIERFAVENNFNLFASLLQHANDGSFDRVNNILASSTDWLQTYEIIALDKTGGYIEYAPRGAEVTYSMTYWNLKDGTKLIAKVEKGCGPVCESEIHFSKYFNGISSIQKTSDIIPTFDTLKPLLIAKYPSDCDPCEFIFHLPRKGKNITLCEESDASGEKCIVLVWKDGVFDVES
ncbi:MAG: hypothetical protein RIF36_17945 [Imperialibacter sp.]|uniref:hypothetical protein n=1 Tax=Imperialibacter sp. TaxID=2038411 RepID=UPI0032ED5103